MAAGDIPAERRVPIYVLVASVAGMLPKPVVQLIAQQPDMVLVGHAQSQIELLLAAEKGIDVLVLGAEHATPLPGICSHLLGEFPDLRILVLAPGDEAATLYWLGLRQQRLRQSAPMTVIEGIRKAYHINPTT